MDLWQLHIFTKVIELKSFSKAGKKVHLSQPTVSSHIKDLENHFDCKLIDRLSKEAIPTPAGELLYNYARKLLALREETEIAMAGFQGRMRGRLTIGGSTIPGGYILPQIIGRFTKKFPEVKISLIVADTERVITDTLNGDIELGVVGAKTGLKQIRQEHLIDDEMKLVLPGDHRWAGLEKVTIDQMLMEPFIIREPGSGTLKSIEASLARQGYGLERLNTVAEMGSTESVIRGIKSGIGVSILSAIAVAESLSTGSLKALVVEGLDLNRSFYLAFHRQRSHSPLCEVFANFLRETIKGLDK